MNVCQGLGLKAEHGGCRRDGRAASVASLLLESEGYQHGPAHWAGWFPGLLEHEENNPNDITRCYSDWGDDHPRHQSGVDRRDEISFVSKALRSEIFDATARGVRADREGVIASDNERVPNEA
jgi:hypothetical protein